MMLDDVEIGKCTIRTKTRIIVHDEDDPVEITREVVPDIDCIGLQTATGCVEVVIRLYTPVLCAIELEDEIVRQAVIVFKADTVDFAFFRRGEVKCHNGIFGDSDICCHLLPSVVGQCDRCVVVGQGIIALILIAAKSRNRPGVERDDVPRGG